jgi:hypothetical protein
MQADKKTIVDVRKAGCKEIGQTMLDANAVSWAQQFQLVVYVPSTINDCTYYWVKSMGNIYEFKINGIQWT